MAEPLKRLNYFTGQFLEEPDFKAEQLYHERVRRRLTYAMFKPGILNGLDVTKIDGGQVLVQKGVAIDALENDPAGDQESRAVVITEDQTISLRGGPGGLGFVDGDSIFLYLRFLEDPVDGAGPKNTRFQLREEILAVKDTGAGFTLNPNLNLLIGKLTLAAGDLTVVAPAAANRMLATLRLGSPGPSPGAVLDSIAVQPATPTLTVGTSQLFQAIGTFDGGASTRALTAADGLAWSSSNTGLLTIASTGLAQAVAAGGPITITATVGAITGTTAVQVQPPAVVVPVIQGFSPLTQKSGSKIIIVGTNIRAATLVPPPVVRFVNPGNPADFTPGTGATALVDSGGFQQVEVTVPAKGSLPTSVNLVIELSGTPSAPFATQFKFKP